MKTSSSILSILFIAMAGCAGEKPSQDDSAPPKAPIVNDSSRGLFFSWFEGDEPGTAESPEEIPKEHRGEVRVQDPNLPPDERNPDWVFLANLNEKDKKGNYKVEVVLRADWEKRRRPEPQKTSTTSRPAMDPDGAQKVVMYATKTCPVCIKARRWLVQEKIPFEEKDVGSDRAAAAELSAKGQAQGVSTSGVPVFDIGGKLIPGFDKDLIRKLLAQPAVPVPPPAPLSPPLKPVSPPSDPQPKPSTPAGQIVI